MTRKNRRRLTTVGVLIIIGAAVYGVVRLTAGKAKPAAPPGGGQTQARPLRQSPEPFRAIDAETQPTGSAPASRPTPTTSPFSAVRPTGPGARAAAAADLARGLAALQQGKLLEARNLLSDALWSRCLDERQAQAARQDLTDLANKTILTRTLLEGDPTAFEHAVKPRDVLANLERQYKLHVPPELLARINGLASPDRIQIGQKLKLLRGPFHAAVSKRRFTLDVYLQEDRTGRMIFIRRFPVGAGQNGSTPAGLWRVALGGKLRNAPWTPPTSSPLARKKIFRGQPGYALGKAGLWISLEGIEANPYTADDGYGIHDTADQDSIGKDTSLGCIRMKDGDIDLVFSMLYESWSTVSIEE